jgi:hypothetical protein
LSNGEDGYNTIVLVCCFNKKNTSLNFNLRYFYFFFSSIQYENQSSTTIDMLKDCSPCNNKLIKISDKHEKFLIENLNLLRKQKELCDVILIIGQNQIPAHRAVLSGRTKLLKIKKRILYYFLFF